MLSNDRTDYSKGLEMPGPGALLMQGGWSRFAEEARNACRAQSFARCARLAEEHRDLDETISLLSGRMATDEALLSRLKKWKLSIKDEIFRLETAVAG